MRQMRNRSPDPPGPPAPGGRGGPGRRARLPLWCWWALLALSPSIAQANLRVSAYPMKVHLSLEPGTQRMAAVNVCNNGEEPVRVVATVSDWTATGDGGMNLAPGEPVDRSATALVSPEITEFTVAPHSTRVVRVTATLPDSASGSYWTMLFFECSGGARPNGLGVGTKARLGTTVYLTAAGTEHRDDAILAMNVGPGAGAGSRALSFSLANRGNVYYYPAGWIQVFRAGGERLFQAKLPTRVLLPGRDTVYRQAWGPSAAGAYRFVVTLDLGLESLLQGVKDFSIPDTLALVRSTADQPPSAPDQTATSDPKGR
jgi:hypothetical protein